MNELSAMSDPTPATAATDTPLRPLLRFRRTRIAVSVIFGLLTVALCVLWVRSLWRSDWIVWSYSAGRFAVLQSVGSHLFLKVQKSGPIPARDPKIFLFRSRTPTHEDLALPNIDLMHVGFGYYFSDDYKFLAAPYWFLMLV